MYRLFIANKNYSSWSLRPWLLMRALRIPFDEVQLRFRDHGGHLQEFQQVSPAGLVPCLHDDRVVIWDSLAISEYLAERHQDVWPGDPLARAWARCAAAEMHSGFTALRSQCSMSVGLRVRLAAIDAALERDCARIEALWNEGVRRHGGPWLAGPAFGAVDAFFAPVAFRVQTYGLQLKGAAHAYCQHLLLHPDMLAWQGDALAETFREAEHEAWTLAAGTVLQDLRAPATSEGSAPR